MAIWETWPENTFSSSFNTIHRQIISTDRDPIFSKPIFLCLSLMLSCMEEIALAETNRCHQYNDLNILTKRMKGRKQITYLLCAMTHAGFAMQLSTLLSLTRIRIPQKLAMGLGKHQSTTSLTAHFFWPKKLLNCPLDQTSSLPHHTDHGLQKTLATETCQAPYYRKL